MVDDGVSPLFVVEIGTGPAGAYCGWLFTRAGHDVVLVEPPGGVALRDPDGPSGSLESSLFLAFGTGKRSVILDWASDDGRADLHELLRGADVVITDDPDVAAAAGIAGDERGRLNAGLVHASISPFGESGPYAGAPATSATLYAQGGYTYITGEADREPLSGPEFFPEFLAGATGFAAAHAALLARAGGATGQKVEVSALECVVAGHQFTHARAGYQGATLERTGNRYASLIAVNFYTCEDGVIALAASTDAQIEQLFLLMGRTDLVGDPRFSAYLTPPEHARLFDEEISPWFAAHKRDEVVEICQAFRVPCAPVLEVDEVLEHEQLIARGFWQAVAGPDGRPLRVPTRPFLLAGGREGVEAAPAPGAHQHLLDKLPAREPAALDRVPGLPLAGIRVLDLTRVWSGPVATRMLADLGAEVIKIEHPTSRGGHGPNGADFQQWNRNGLFNELNRNKRSIAMDLRIPEARDAFLALVAKSDVVIENFSPRVMGNLGVDFDALTERRPDVVMVSMPGYGLSGPMRDGVAYGTTIDAEAGTASVIGYEGEGPMRMGVAFPDYAGGVHATGATIAALFERARTGRGQHIDLAQFESICTFMGPYAVAVQRSGVRPERMGNRSSRFAPQGAYGCGDGTWIVVSVTSDDEWRSLCAVTGLRELEAYATEETRAARQREIDVALGPWFAARDAAVAAGALRAAGVPAGEVLSGPQLATDPHLAARGFFVELEHPLAGLHRYPGLPIRMAGLRPETWRDAPCLAADNRDALRDIAGYDEAAIDRLYELGGIADQPQA